MGRIAFSADGKEIYYTQNDSWTSGEHAQMKMIRYAANHWGKPTVINQRFITPTLSIDGNVMYMRKEGMNNVWQSHRTGDDWSAPAPFLEKPFGVYDFMPTLTGNYYVGSDPSPDDTKNGSTYVYSLLTISDGNVSVKSLGRPLNGPGFNGDFFIAPDESYMIVSANETKTYESELYISFRKPDLTWTAPVSLGPKINNGLAHRWGQYVTSDGKYLFYSYGTSEKDCAIYWVRFDSLLENLRPRQLSMAAPTQEPLGPSVRKATMCATCAKLPSVEVTGVPSNTESTHRIRTSHRRERRAADASNPECVGLGQPGSAMC